MPLEMELVVTFFMEKSEHTESVVIFEVIVARFLPSWGTVAWDSSERGMSA